MNAKLLEARRKLPTLRIGTVAARVALSTSTLRQYERLGLVLPFKESGGQRLFSITDVEWLKRLKAHFAETSTGPSCLSRLMRSMPAREIRWVKTGTSCPVPETGQICWQAASSDRQLCRSCPAYTEKTSMLSFDIHFRVQLRSPKGPF